MGEGVPGATWAIKYVLLSAQNYGDISDKKLKIRKFLLIKLLSENWASLGAHISKKHAILATLIFLYIVTLDISEVLPEFKKNPFWGSWVYRALKLTLKNGFFASPTLELG